MKPATDCEPKNRCALARRRAGLSVGQAAKLLGVERVVIDQFEAADVDDIHEDGITFAGRMAELYRVRLEWMLGDVERYDYAAADAMRGADKLPPVDRDIVAEFAASMPRRKA